MKVLVVDDNRAVLSTTVHFLKSHNLDAAGAEGGLQALSACREASFDVVVTDLSMPDKDGFELADDVRAIGGVSKLILITGLALTPQQDSLVRERFDEVLMKPFRLETLVDAIYASSQGVTS
ncbi:MAG: response regulator [Burkholderiaceae bacterium]